MNATEAIKIIKVMKERTQLLEHDDDTIRILLDKKTGEALALAIQALALREKYETAERKKLKKEIFTGQDLINLYNEGISEFYVENGAWTGIIQKDKTGYILLAGNKNDSGAFDIVNTIPIVGNKEVYLSISYI